MARGPRGLSMGGVPEGTRMKTTPIRAPRTRRTLNFRGLTSIPAGKVVPLWAFPLLREDALQSCQLNFAFELYETAEILANPVMLNVRAYLVPNLAFARFNGSIDTLNRSYAGEAEPNAQPAVPYFQGTSVEIGPDEGSFNSIPYYLGVHVPEGALYNAAYHEAYNVIWNHRAQNRSPDIELIPESNKGLLPAFWRHPDLGHIVPDFDQASIEGEIPLTITDPRVGIHGLSFTGTPIGAGPYSDPRTGQAWTGTTPKEIGITEESGGVYPAIWGELAESGANISLANIGLAARTKTFATLRKQYAELDAEYIIDMLMSGIRMPTEAEKQPHLLANIMTTFGQGKRYATDSVDLTASVSSGAAAVQMRLRTPPVNTGGIVMVTCELYPEQLWERREDPYMRFTNTTPIAKDVLPDYMRDTLDPEQVDIVECQRVDVRHSTPTATFGYEPLHQKWATFPPRIGGKFYRPEVDLPADEDRARIWASETVDPTLSKDFYLVTNLHTKPFVVTDQDPAEVLIKGHATISGLTVFGRPLLEASDDYNIVLEDAPVDLIDKEPVAGSAVAAPPMEPEAKDLEEK